MSLEQTQQTMDITTLPSWAVEVTLPSFIPPMSPGPPPTLGRTCGVRLGFATSQASSLSCQQDSSGKFPKARSLFERIADPLVIVVEALKLPLVVRKQKLLHLTRRIDQERDPFA
jgi:hypothetical protein